jgi:hypothetical protein
MKVRQMRKSAAAYREKKVGGLFFPHFLKFARQCSAGFGGLGGLKNIREERT